MLFCVWMNCFAKICSLFLLLLLLLLSRDRISLYSTETHSVDHAGLKLRNLPAPASQVLGLKACATTAQL